MFDYGVTAAIIVFYMLLLLCPKMLTKRIKKNNLKKEEEGRWKDRTNREKIYKPIRRDKTGRLASPFFIRSNPL
jgi:hypothetical protein